MRLSVTVFAAASLVICVALLLSFNRHADVGTSRTVTPAPVSQRTDAEPRTAPATRVEPPSAQPREARPLDTLVAATQSADALVRADAIAELARSPDAGAVAALQRVLNDGDPQQDQPLALQSLGTLARQRGDANGAIRDALRYAVYHATDESVVQNAQLMLDDIEALAAR